jgi:hypothetical protein
MRTPVASISADTAPKIVSALRCLSRQKGHQLEVGHHAGEELAGRDLSGHHRAPCAEFRQRLEQPPQLADRHGATPVLREGVEERRIGLVLEGDEGDLGAAAPGAFRQQGGVAALSGDDGDGPFRTEVAGEEA